MLCSQQSGGVAWAAEGALRGVRSGSSMPRLSSHHLCVPLFPSLTPGTAEALVAGVCDDKEVRPLSPHTVRSLEFGRIPGVREELLVRGTSILNG